MVPIAGAVSIPDLGGIYSHFRKPNLGTTSDEASLCA